MRCSVAVVDSGLEPRAPDLEPLGEGIQLQVAGDRAREGADSGDALGHGTAMARLIREECTRSTLHAVRIFRTRLVAPVTAYVAAIDWARTRGVTLVCLGVGVSKMQWRDTFARAVDEAAADGVLVVAPAGTEASPSLPGVLRGAIAVRGVDGMEPAATDVREGVVLASTGSGRLRLRPRSLFPEPEARAVARVSGILARWMCEEGPRDADASRDFLSSRLD